MIADIAPGHISIKHGFMGPNYTTVSACASSANALIDALNTIRMGYCDVVVSGGSEAAVNLSGVAGFNAMHALSTNNDSPEAAKVLWRMYMVDLFWEKVHRYLNYEELIT